MWGRQANVAASLPSALLGAISAVLFAPILVQAQDLGSVLEKQANLTTFTGLFKANPDIFGKLPSSGATILAPSDTAFQRLQSFNIKNQTLVTEMLLYHTITSKISTDAIKKGDSIWASTTLNSPASANVTGGQNVILTKQPGGEVVLTSGQASRTTIITPDIPFTGGLVQVIDSLMITPASLERTARDAYTDLSAFLGALYATDIISEFAGASNITIFVPHAAAFQLLAGTLSGMDKTSLAKVLRYHMVPGQVVQSSTLANGTTFKTAAGPNVKVQRFNNNIYVDAAQVIQTDILIANGVVQMIDNVLDPGKPDASPDVALATQAPVFTPSGSTATGSSAPTPFVSNLPCTVDCPVSPTGKSGGGVNSGTSKDAAPRCTGVVGSVGLGVAVGGVLGMEIMGLV